jgi:two-component system sensor histidine kinase and response regulator WspE
MKKLNPDDLGSLSMMEIFQVETDNQTAIISTGLLELERNPGATNQLEALMRAAHSLKGAARIVNQPVAVSIAHAIEDCFVAAQQSRIVLRHEAIDVLLHGVDLLIQISKQTTGEIGPENVESTRLFLTTLAEAIAGKKGTALATPTRAATQTTNAENAVALRESLAVDDRVLRLTAQNLNRLLGLAGESLVESRWLHPFADSLLRLKRMQLELAKSLEHLRDPAVAKLLPEAVRDQIVDAAKHASGCREFLVERIAELEMHDRRSANVGHRLYREVLQCRMRPFGDGASRFQRTVRDLSRLLGKKTRLEIVGADTQVDRDILEKLDASVGHLLRNAVDHGCETPEERRRAGKPEECTIRLEARHHAGLLLIVVADDGAGIDPEKLRTHVLQKRLVTAAIAEKLSQAELLEFLLLPGFTLKENVTEISGRGVGLDVVQNTVKSVRGKIRITTFPGRGMRFQLHLPVTLSVLRALLVEVAGEPYAIPLSQINRTLKLSREDISRLEGRQHFDLDGQAVGLLTAHQILERGEPQGRVEQFPVVVLGERTTRYGLVVDRFLGERELVVQALDRRLGKIKNISAGALMEDGAPVLIVDVEDMIHSIERLAADGQLARVKEDTEFVSKARAKRILIVDDSLTVRELERKLLAGHGYVAEMAVDGMDAWNAMRTGNYDLVITDVDMPRMDGIELCTLIKQDLDLKKTPVMIVSYKDREEDRLRGLEAGADYYLTKGSFQNEALLRSVTDLIGRATP